MPSLIRHREVSRLEGFSDAVFGFALTLLVVSLETPKTTDDLRRLLGGLLPFAVTFAMVCWIWYQHNTFFRRYGLQDAWTVFLNCVLLFVVLFYVYPLKFLAMALLGGGFDDAVGNANSNGRMIMFMYSSGVLVLFAIFVLLHWHAWRNRTALGLDERELLTLRFSTRAHVFSSSIAVASLLLLVFVQQSWYSGIIYGLMGPLHAWNGFRGGAALDALKKKQLAPAE